MKAQVTGALEIPSSVGAATPATIERAAEVAAFAPTVDRDALEPQTTRVDLIFYDVDHSGPSYEARVFVGEKAGEDTPREVEHGYIGSFTVFGHGDCYGDVGHCDVDQGTYDEYDVRPPHPLKPWTKTIIVPSEAIGLLTGDSVRLSVVAVPIERDRTLNVRFDRVRLAAYSE